LAYVISVLCMCVCVCVCFGVGGVISVYEQADGISVLNVV